jgi:hypothetical protein
MSSRLQIEYILYVIKHSKMNTFTTSALWEAIFPETLKSENTSFVGAHETELRQTTGKQNREN